MRLALHYLSLFSSIQVLAHPVAYQGATGAMTWDQPFISHTWITYSFHSDSAVAARIMRFDVPQGELQ
jgi:hypothetical protein